LDGHRHKAKKAATSPKTPKTEFGEFLKETEYVENTSESRQWAVENMEDVTQKQGEYWPVWQTKSTGDKLQLTLLPEDGS